jgi:hypothetical protein
MGVVRNRFELVVDVEAHGTLVDGIDHDELAARASCSLDDRLQRDDQELATETLPMEIVGERQLGEQDRRDEMGLS